MHAIHHERDAHSGNYCDLPVIDMIFSTYRNPETFDGAAGFYDGASGRVVDMLLGRDVSVPGAVSVPAPVSATVPVSAPVSATVPAPVPV